MQPSRRHFLRNSALATAGTFLVPQFLKAYANAAPYAEGRVLIIVQLSGGNDGLNAVIPYADDRYYQQRPTLAVPKDDLWKANDRLGFHNELGILKQLYEAGDLCVVNNVGYPDPDRSHFRSMDIWHTASASNEFLSTGWLGRYLDNQRDLAPYAAIELNDTLSLALKGKTARGFAMRQTRQLRNSTRNPLIQAINDHEADHDHATVDYLYKTLADTVSSAEYLYETSVKNGKAGNQYPGNPLGRSLKQIADLMTGGCTSHIYYADMGGFDTHVNQKNQQERLFKQYSEAMTALVEDLKKHKLWDRTLVMTFSEFGRRVAENGSRGTDHGAANNVYLMGGNLKKPGFFNPAPDLGNLQNGDLKHTVDFRQIYATLLNDWLQVPLGQSIGTPFEPLRIV